MARKRKGTPIHGWINLHKPVGVTSTQALGIVKRALKPMKAGHGGTLDPLADGVLPICLGEATKTVNFAMDAMKIYEFEITWGEQRSTDDAEGEVLASSDARPTLTAIEALLTEFTGDIEQIPPQFSAIKVDGERAYDIARDGEQIELKSRAVYIEILSVVKHESDTTRFTCTCGKGTYIRSLARDMGLKVGCYGYISALTRTAVGPLTLESAISLDIFKEMIDNTPDYNVMLPIETVLDDIPVLALKEQEAQRLRNGNPLSFIARPDMDRLKNSGIVPANCETALATFKDHPIALVEVDGPEVKVLRVLNL